MITKEELLTILVKYGMDSKYQDPFIYMDEEHIGFMYSFSHALYGLLHRVFFCSSKEEAEEFVYQYWWYKTYQHQYDVTLELDDYEILNPHLTFKIHDKILHISDMKALLANPEELPMEKKRQKNYQRLIRTAYLLVKIIEEKIKVQNDTYRNVRELMLEYQRQENEFLQLYNRYQKDHKPFNQIDDKLEEDINMSSEIQMLNEQIEVLTTTMDFEMLQQFIETLWSTLLTIESEKGHLQNKYLLIKLPIDLEDIRKKKSYMEYVFNKKKGLFAKKENVLEELQKIEQESEIHKIVRMKDFIDNEVNRLQEKYSIISEMDYATLGDYLNEFDNLGISSPLECSEKPKEKEFSKEEIIATYYPIYDSLSMEEQQILAIYYSFLQPICDVILKGLLQQTSYLQLKEQLKLENEAEIQQDIQILSDPENVFLRMKHMKLLSIANEDLFLDTLFEAMQKLLNMTTFKVNGISYAFGKSQKEQTYDLYHASFKNVGVPSQGNDSYNIHDIFQLHSGVSVLFSPYFYSVRDPYFHDFTIVENSNRENVTILLKKYQLNYENSDIIKVSQFRAKDNMKDGCKVVEGMYCDKVAEYRSIAVTK